MTKRMKHFSELTPKELYDIMRLRVDVFVVEQCCPYHELDGLDVGAYHLWLEDEDGIAAYLRILPAGVRFAEPAIGRIISARRGRGIGSELVRAGISAVRELYGTGKITIEAQLQAKGFYEKNGFHQISDEFDEDGIPHILMQTQ